MSALFAAIEDLNERAALLRRAGASAEEAIEWITDSVIEAERAVYLAPVVSFNELMAKIAVFEVEQAEMFDPALGGEGLQAIFDGLRDLLGYDQRMQPQAQLTVKCRPASPARNPRSADRPDARC